jgi:hypothetical protein
MRSFKFKKANVNDLKFNLQQQNLSRYVRAGTIDTVDTERGLCTVRWFDRPGVHTNVILTQGSDSEWHIPRRNAVVLVEFDVKEQARIIRYINLGWAKRLKDGELPPLSPGEKLWEVGGTVMYMQENGDMMIVTERDGVWGIENESQTAYSQTVNWRVVTDGGRAYFGVVKRLEEQPDGSKELRTITNMLGSELVEYTLSVYEASPNPQDNIVPRDPVATIEMGNVVDDDGKVLNRNSEVANPAQILANKDLAARITLKNGTQIAIDKNGAVNINAKKLNINGGAVDIADPDVALGLDSPRNDGAQQGDRAARQHDEVQVPVGIVSADLNNPGLLSKSAENIAVLQQFVTGIITPVGAALVFNPSVVINSRLKGQITNGSPKVFIGEK